MAPLLTLEYVYSPLTIVFIKTWLLLTISSAPNIMKRPWPSFPKITPF